jgi:N-acetylglucosamine-6-phosphate deacetylase
MALAFTHGRILTRDGFLDAHTVLVEDGRIAAILDKDDPRLDGVPHHDLDGALLLPGFIDTQVNGGGGVLFNDDPSVATIRRIGEAHRPFGTTGFLPTLISDDLDKVERAIAAVAQAIREDVPGVLGIHIEGPFLSVARKGVHDSQKFRALDDKAVALLSSLEYGKTLVTLAPETTTPQMIAKLKAAGVILAAGHTDADYQTMRAALKAGVTGFTHLFNAMSQLTGREPGVVGAALADPESYCGIIADGRHVHPEMLKLALKAKPYDRFMLVTDALANAGTSLTSFQLQGARITVKDGVCVDDKGTLAGSVMLMNRAVRNARDLLGVSLPQAVAMASRVPAAFLGLSQVGEIAPGFRAHFVVADDDLNVKETWMEGRKA